MVTAFLLPSRASLFQLCPLPSQQPRMKRDRGFLAQPVMAVSCSIQYPLPRDLPFSCSSCLAPLSSPFPSLTLFSHPGRNLSCTFLFCHPISLCPFTSRILDGLDDSLPISLRISSGVTSDTPVALHLPSPAPPITRYWSNLKPTSQCLLSSPLGHSDCLPSASQSPPTDSLLHSSASLWASPGIRPWPLLIFYCILFSKELTHPKSFHYRLHF